MPDVLELERQHQITDLPLERVKMLIELCKRVRTSHLAQAIGYGEEARGLAQKHEFGSE